MFPALVLIQKCRCLASHPHPAFFKGKEKRRVKSSLFIFPKYPERVSVVLVFNRNPRLSKLEKSGVCNGKTPVEKVIFSGHISFQKEIEVLAVKCQ